jgi:hypothetical protein
MDAHFRWFEGEKAQFRFVPYDWAFLFDLAQSPTFQSPVSQLPTFQSPFPNHRLLITTSQSPTPQSRLFFDLPFEPFTPLGSRTGRRTERVYVPGNNSICIDKLKKVPERYLRAPIAPIAGADHIDRGRRSYLRAPLAPIAVADHTCERRSHRSRVPLAPINPIAPIDPKKANTTPTARRPSLQKSPPKPQIAYGFQLLAGKKRRDR